MRKRWVWTLVLALALQSLAFAACAEEKTVEPATGETFILRDGFTWKTTQEELLALMEGYEYSVYSSHESDFSDAPEGSQEKRMNTASMMAITMISPVFLSKDIRERWRCFTEGKRRWSLGIALRKETLKS